MTTLETAMLEILLHGAQQLGFKISPKQAQQFQLYYEELIKWNRRINLTAITKYDEVQLKHFLDSLTIITALENTEWLREKFLLLDVGTGAGMPGVPLKILLPRARLTLLDATTKKTAFLQHLTEKLGLDFVKILTGRAEEIAHQSDYREAFELVVSRAVSKLPTTIELTLPFCHKGGLVITLRKGHAQQEVIQATRAIDILGGKLKEIKKVNLKPLEQRFLVVVKKVSPTPQHYPRRVGIPTKRHL